MISRSPGIAARMLAQREGSRTASSSSVVLRLQCRCLEIVGLDLTEVAAHVACAASTVRHAARRSVGYFGFMEHVCDRAGQAGYILLVAPMMSWMRR